MGVLLLTVLYVAFGRDCYGNEAANGFVIQNVTASGQLRTLTVPRLAIGPCGYTVYSWDDMVPLVWCGEKWGWMTAKPLELSLPKELRSVKPPKKLQR